MSLSLLFQELKRANVSISREGDGLKVQAPPGAMTAQLREQLAKHKGELMQWLSEARQVAADVSALPVCEPDPARRYEPFPLSDMQLGFYLADDPYMEFHVRPHYYLERTLSELDVARYEAAWNKALRRHCGELVIVDDEGQLATVENPAPLVIERIDLSALSGDALEQALMQIRAQMMHAELPLNRWPWVDLRVSSWIEAGVRRNRIHYNHNNFFSDGYGTTRLLQEIDSYYREPELTLPPLTLAFRDAALTLDRLAHSTAGQQARRYWEERLDHLPEAPSLPLLTHLNRRCRSTLKRRERFIAADIWSAFVAQTRSAGVTPSNALFTAYAEVLAAWSNSRHFVLSNMMTRRLDIHPEIRDIVGNFASLYPLEIDFRPNDRFIDRARRLQEQVLRDARHLQWGGMQVMQSINRRRGGFGSAAIPFVVGSGLFMEGFEKAEFSCLETSQVMLDHQFWELADGQLFYVWDLLEEFFPPGVVDAMWQAYAALIERLAQEPALWLNETLELTPAAELQVRAQVTPAANEPPRLRLEEYLATAARQRPDAIAVSDSAGTISYAVLMQTSDAIAQQLRNSGVGRGSKVAIIADRNVSLVQAVFGVLKTGAAYVPVDPSLPEDRRSYILDNCEAQVVLADTCYVRQLHWPESVRVFDIAQLCLFACVSAPLNRVGDNSDLAYLIYTSGSTGRPKGVMIDHRGAVNTIEDVNRRFAVGPQDRLLGISSFGFDLSVYDLFGAAAAGARLVYPEPELSLNPAHWIDVLQREQITLWNSAPPLALLMVEAAEAQKITLPDLRLVLLSGDWIPLDLPERLRRIAPNVNVVSLGGATEASVWSICYEVQTLSTEWSSIPYGYPMQNQPWYILDAWGRQTPDWCTGELYIGGIGLAQGYWADLEKSVAAFGCHTQHGELSQQRLYRTGDLGRYRPGGVIEFLGRRDTQVKIQGHRIELGEIESELGRCSGVASAVATVQRVNPESAPRLLAYVVAAPDAELQLEALRSHLTSKLPAYMVPHAIGVLPRLPLSVNGKLDRAALPPIDESDTAVGAARYEPRNQIEAQLRDIWRTVLGREVVDLSGDFFEMGGQSFEAVRIVGAIRNQIGMTLSIGVIWETRNIERLAEFLSQDAMHQAHPHRVSLRQSESGVPLYLVHPAGGHVMCYRQLSSRLDAPVTAFQAAGLDGQSQALDNIAAMAHRYVQALIEVQPHGPVFLGGWSSGALIAFEMAAQLQDIGRQVAGVVLVDCPAPVVSHPDIDDLTLLAWFLEDLALDLPVATLLAPLELSELDDVQQLQAVAQQLRELNHTAMDTLSALLPVYRVFKGIVRGSRDYRPAAIDADLLLLRARDGVVSEFATHSHTAAVDWGWSNLTRGRITAHYRAGTHHTLLLPPHLDQVADTIAKWLHSRDSAHQAVAARLALAD